MIKYRAMKRVFSLLTAIILAGFVFADIQVINGQKWICEDGLCVPVEGNSSEVGTTAADESDKVRIAHGYMDVEKFIAFIENNEEWVDEGAFFKDKAIWLILLIVYVGGLAMNLTPCVLPMIPINMMIIGRSASRGLLYGLGIAIAYGVLGLLSALGGIAFGQIQSNPWFNVVITVIFVALALSMLGVFYIDFSKKRNNFASMQKSMLPGLFAFFMGIISAILAGACIAPIVLAVLLFTADLFAKGHFVALALPFVLGAGMASPWPLVGAGLQVLPKPGSWMTKVNRIFGILVLGFAIWYGYLAYKGFTATNTASSSISSPAEFNLKDFKRPLLVDCWALSCKNCSAMDRNVLSDDRVKQAIEKNGITFVKLQAEDLNELRKLSGFEGVKGLPAFLIFE